MPNIKKRYVAALGSTDLTDDLQHINTEYLAAIALSSELGSLLFRAKYFNDRSSISSLQYAWRLKIAKRAEKRGWLNRSNEVSDTSLSYWLNNICNVCHGRTAPKIENAPMLDDIVCPACNGSGKAILTCKKDIEDHVKDAVEMLNQMERESGGLAIKKLSDEFGL